MYNTENISVKRCRWVNAEDPLYVAYHDREWGFPCHDDGYLFETLLLEGFQAGLSWACILKKRENFRSAFDGFSPEKISTYSEEKCACLMNNRGIIRNLPKIRGAVNNARVFLEIQKEYGTFSNYLWHFTDGNVVDEPWDVRTTSPLSDEISADLKKRGMKYMGSTTVYAYLQAVGIINGHDPDCFCCKSEK